MVAAAGVMLLGACGGDDGEDGGAASGGDQAEEYVDAVSADMRENDEIPLDAERADCAAAAIVDVAGADALSEAGVSPEDLGETDSLSELGVELPDDATDRLSAALDDCDLAPAIEDVMIDGFADEFGSGLPADAAACLRDNLDDEALTDAAAATFVDGDAQRVQDAIGPAVAACPPVAKAVLLAQAPVELSPSAEACLTAFVEGNPDLVARSFGSGDTAAGQQLGASMAQACPEVAAALGNG